MAKKIKKLKCLKCDKSRHYLNTYNRICGTCEKLNKQASLRYNTKEAVDFYKEKDFNTLKSFWNPKNETYKTKPIP